MSGFIKWLGATLLGAIAGFIVLTLLLGLVHSKTYDCHREGLDTICKLHYYIKWESPFH